MLAAISIALVAVVVTNTSAFPRANLTLAVLVASTYSFVAAVQCGFRARQWVVTPEEMITWRPTTPDDALRQEMLTHRTNFMVWANRCRWAYNLAILLLTFGVLTMLAPRPLAHRTADRLAPTLVALVGFTVETVWFMVTFWKDWCGRQQRLTNLAQAASAASREGHRTGDAES